MVESHVLLLAQVTRQGVGGERGGGAFTERAEGRGGGREWGGGGGGGYATERGSGGVE